MVPQLGSMCVVTDMLSNSPSHRNPCYTGSQGWANGRRPQTESILLLDMARERVMAFSTFPVVLCGPCLNQVETNIESTCFSIPSGPRRTSPIFPSKWKVESNSP
eukprot:jgi/Botrbrau1/12927/Bobra.92_1s0007.1